MEKLNWKNKGFTPVPNIVINNPALPKCVRLTYLALSERAFGKKYSIMASEDTLAKDVGASRSTIIRHLNVLEALGLIRRIRIGRGMTNTIVLTLKLRLAESKSYSHAIEAELGGLSALVLKREKLTMKEALALVSRHKRKQREVSHILQQAQAILKQKRGIG